MVWIVTYEKLLIKFKTSFRKHEMQGVDYTIFANKLNVTRKK